MDRRAMANVKRVFYYACFLSGSMPFFSHGVPALWNFIHIQGEMQAAAADEPVDAPKGPWSAPNVSVPAHNKLGYRTLLNFERIYFARGVTAMIFVPNERLRGGDGQPVDPNQRYRAANALAGELAARECKVFLSVLARQCKVVSARASARSQAGYQVKLTLSFVQKDDFGRVLANNGLSYSEKMVRLNGGQGAVATVSLGSQEAERRRHYERARRACGEMRAATGNCALQDVIVSGSFDRENRVVRTRAHATVASLRL